MKVGRMKHPSGGNKVKNPGKNGGKVIGMYPSGRPKYASSVKGPGIQLGGSASLREGRTLKTSSSVKKMSDKPAVGPLKEKIKAVMKVARPHRDIWGTSGVSAAVKGAGMSKAEHAAASKHHDRLAEKHYKEYGQSSAASGVYHKWKFHEAMAGAHNVASREETPAGGARKMFPHFFKQKRLR